MATAVVNEILPPPLDSTAEPPPLFDGTARLYICYTCPYAQRAWIARNSKGLQEEIKLIPIDLSNRPAWYKEKVYPANKVPSLEHNGKVIGESLDLIKYVDVNFGGPSLFPSEPAKREFGEELLSYIDTFHHEVHTSFKGDPVKDSAPAFDYLEKALQKFNEGPFLLGEYSLADIAYIPFVERFQILFAEVYNHDFTAGRPKLAAWLEEMNKMPAYKQTRTDPKDLLPRLKKRILGQR